MTDERGEISLSGIKIYPCKHLQVGGYSYLFHNYAASPIEISHAVEQLPIPASAFQSKQNNRHQGEENIESHIFRSPIVTYIGTSKQS